MIINGREIHHDSQPYVIAELSANHGGSIDAAKQLISKAKEAGADAVKLQTYRADTITIDCDKQDFQITEGLWAGQNLYNLYEQAYTPWEWHRELFDYAQRCGITLFSSPFDKTAVDLLEELNTPAYKVASFELVDIPLIRYIAKTGKPMIMSTGMATMDEISEAVTAAREEGCKALALLQCVSGYPAPARDYNLKRIPFLKKQFGTVVGLSDHTRDHLTSIASVALGATIVEKHFTLDRQQGGPDDSFSIEPDELRSLCHNTKTAWQSLGREEYSHAESEIGNIQFRRSLYVVKDVKQGELFTEENVKSIRPGHGLAPKYMDDIIGKSAASDITRGTRVEWHLVSDT